MFSVGLRLELGLPWNELLLMEKRHLQTIVPMCLAGLITKHNMHSSSKLLCLVSQGLYHDVSSKDGKRAEPRHGYCGSLFQDTFSAFCALPQRRTKPRQPSGKQARETGTWSCRILFFFNWWIIVLQRWVGFCHTAM